MTGRIQSRLLSLAAFFLTLYAVILTLAPAVRERSWDVPLRWSHWIGLVLWVGAFALIHRQTMRYLPEHDPYLVPLAALLTGWGLLTVWRLTPAFGLRQTLWLAVGAAIFVVGLRLPADLGFLRRYKYLLLSVGLFLTALTLVFGRNPAGGGPRLWLGCCGVYFQPSEPLKLLLLAYLAAYLADQLPIRLRLFPLLFPTLLLTGLALALLLVQRDLGTASIFILLYAIMLYLSSGRRRVLVVSAGVLLAAVLVGYFLVDLVRLRVTTWLNPWLDPSGESYQIVQSLLAIANGGLLGRGPGLGSPTLVPVAHSDFIFAAIAEETGLLGTLALLGLIAFLLSRGMRIALRAPDRFRRLLAAGLTAYLGVQSLLIIGGNLRLLPITGVTLPFLSYGGSSLLTSFLALLFLLLIGGDVEQEPAPLPQPFPYLVLSALLSLGLFTLALADGWWAVVRGPDLLTRTDNPRRAIADRYVPRGALLDRHDTPINVTRGEVGDYTRLYLYPDLAPITGYTHPIYGQAGLEATLDPYLRGLRGNPSTLIWWDHLLYGQPPPGLDVRLSLDLDLQHLADQALTGHAGALILLNAANGEILVMASHPSFDPNALDEEGERLLTDPTSPLLNRAAQGRYPVDAALSPFLLAAADERALPDVPAGLPAPCAVQVARPLTWGSLVAAGCPFALETLGDSLPPETVTTLLERLGFLAAPDLRLPVAPPLVPQDVIGALSDLQVSPLQMALAAASLSAEGVRPAPRLALAVDTPRQGWVILPPLGEPMGVFSASRAGAVVQSMSPMERPFWQSVVVSERDEGPLTWYLAGTLPTWKGTPLALVLVLEEDDTVLAQQIAHTVLQPLLGP
ncbi:MAG: hypothetical protein D6770_00380 [Anaerolineae bacterium]|nr:MAG: hypothetical protein D6770_00380 [Anaerolineae bacterium]